MTDTTPNPDLRRTVICAVADGDHLQEVVAAGRALAQGAGFGCFRARRRTGDAVAELAELRCGTGAALRDVPIPQR